MTVLHSGDNKMLFAPFPQLASAVSSRGTLRSRNLEWLPPSGHRSLHFAFSALYEKQRWKKGAMEHSVYR